ncbi:MAG: hypothetical protein A3K22_02165 [Deltaproteobacteria bacterium RBG_16_42_7]|nr:MAG: hypothetical protein A3K22_02165 [Deltaproteobacteria bacterium RBG_16_42_7]
MFNLDKTTHTYTLNGEPIVSVSQVISPLSDFSSIDPDVMKRAKDYGTAVHRMVELYIGGDLDEEALDSGLKGPLEAFKLWWGNRLYHEGEIRIEEPEYHPKLKYAGTADLAFIYDNLVVDIKTRKPNKIVDILQLEAYAHLYFDNPEKVMKAILYLAQDGCYQYVSMADKRAWPMFRYLLDDYYHKKEVAAKIKGWMEKR